MLQLDFPWARSGDEVLSQLVSDAEKGLSSKEVSRRLLIDGANLLREEARPSRIKRLLAQFASPVVLTLLVATVISAALFEIVDAIAIFSIVIVNAVIGYLHEAKAEAAILALKRLAAPKARVLRDGEVLHVDAADVCAGDILVFEAGDYVPADARVLLANQLSTDEAVLTGESLPVEKNISPLKKEVLLADRHNMIFAGTSVATGSGRAVVTATGTRTEVGHIATLLSVAKRADTPLQKRLAQISKRLLIFCIGVVFVIVIVQGIRGLNWLSILMTSVSLAVAAIPEGLPAVVTLALALAIKRMAKRNAIVRHLPAVETLGSTDVICTDKTGTLTTGEMRVREVFVLDDKLLNHLARTAVLCSNASITGERVLGDPTEGALIYFAKDHGIDIQALYQQSLRIAEWSFDSQRKRMSVAVQSGERLEIHVKGAPEAVMPLCNLTSEQERNVKEVLYRLTSKGYRMLAIAYKILPESVQPSDVKLYKSASPVENNLEFLGLVAIADPLRPESVGAIRECKRAGIQVVMMTGDHPATAMAIARDLGILEDGQLDRVLTGSELAKLSLDELAKRLEKIVVFARVAPEDKFKIVQAYKSLGKIVAMTGDGVNDAPALKEASIGISMGYGGTEVARQASSMILVDDNFATIVFSIKEGRAIYGNIRRTIQYLMSGNLAEILVVFIAAMIGWPTPFAPIHLLWINLVTDGLPSLALAAEPVPKNILQTSMRPSPQKFFDRHFYGELLFISLVTTTMAVAVYGWSLSSEDELTARTHVFSFMVFAELFRSFASRSDNQTFFQLGIKSNLFHLSAVAIPSLFQIALHHLPFFQGIFKVRSLTWVECVGMLFITLLPFFVLELRKLWRQRRK